MADELTALSSELADVVGKVGKSVVAVDARPRFGSSGVFWRPGIVVTAEHTIRREEEIAIGLPDGTKVPATVAGSDPGTDIAVLKADGHAGDSPVVAQPIRCLATWLYPSAARPIRASMRPWGSSAR